MTTEKPNGELFERSINHLSRQQDFHLMTWIQRNFSRFDGLPSTKVAELATTELEFQVTRHNVSGAAKVLDIEWKGLRRAPHIPKAAASKMVELEARVEALETSYQELLKKHFELRETVRTQHDQIHRIRAAIGSKGIHTP